MRHVIFTGILSGGTNLVHSLIYGHSEIGSIQGPFATGFFRTDRLQTFVNALCDGHASLAACVNKWFSGDVVRVPAEDQGHGFETMGECAGQLFPFPRPNFQNQLVVCIRLAGSNMTAADLYLATIIAHRRSLGIHADFSLAMLHYHAPLESVLEANAHLSADKLIICVRDPIQGICSIIRNHLDQVRKHQNFAQALTGIYGGIIHAIDYLHNECLKQFHTCYVRLESLKGDPFAATLNLAGFLEVPWQDTFLDPAFDGIKYHGPRNSHLVFEGQFAKNPSRDPSEFLSRADELLFRCIFAASAKMLGYSGYDCALPDDQFDFLTIAPMQFETLILNESSGLCPTRHPDFMAFRELLRQRFQFINTSVPLSRDITVI